MKSFSEKGEYTSPKLELVAFSLDVLTTSMEEFDNVVDDPGEFSFGALEV